MAFSTTNPVTVGAATKKAHYDTVFDNTLALRDYLLGAQDLGANINISGGRLVGVGGAPANLLHLYGTTASSLAVQQIFEGRFGGWGAGYQLSSRTSSGGTLVPMAQISATGTAPWDTTAANQDAKVQMLVAQDGALVESITLYPNGVVIPTSLSVGHTAISGPDVISVGDANFQMQWNGTNALSVYDTGDYVIYVRASNEWQHTIGSATKMAVNSNGVLLVDGAAGTPSYSFINDTNTGIYRAGADDMRFVANGTAAAQVFWDVGQGVAQLLGADGNGERPGISFISDGDSGLYRAGANEVRLMAGGSSGTFIAVKNKNVTMFGDPSGIAGMERGMFLANATVVPTGNPTSGIFVYVESGAGKARGTSGTITTWAPAEPHCPACGQDAIVEWRNNDQGWHYAFCLPCLVDEIEDLKSGRARGALQRGVIHRLRAS